MAVIKRRRDPLKPWVDTGLLLTWLYLVVQGALWWYAATVILLTELAARTEALLALL